MLQGALSGQCPAEGGQHPQRYCDLLQKCRHHLSHTSVAVPAEWPSLKVTIGYHGLLQTMAAFSTEVALGHTVTGDISPKSFQDAA